MSEKIYRDLMKVGGTGCRPHSNRVGSAKSASSQSQFSFFASPRSSAKSKTSKHSVQGSYTDFDIIKSKSWSGSKVKTGAYPLLNDPARRTDRLIRSELATPSLSVHSSMIERLPATSVSVPTLNGKGRQQQPPKSWLSAKGSQVQRLHQEWAAVDHCRAMKRASEMMQHRLDPMYRLSGSNVPLQERYHVDEAELERLRVMTAARGGSQNDLKRIKYPYSERLGTPSKERTTPLRATKPEAPTTADTAETAPTAENGAEDNTGLHRADTDDPATEERHDHHLADPQTEPQPPSSLAPPPQPSSPISTPEVTPRPKDQSTEEEQSENKNTEKEISEEASHVEPENSEGVENEDDVDDNADKDNT